MSVARLPDFERALAMAGGGVEAPELAECHGIACGLLCRLAGAGRDSFLALLDTLAPVRAVGTDLTASLEALWDATRAQMADEGMAFALWLPGDEEPLEERTMAMAQWCSGFLAGLGGAADGGLEGISEDARDALDDLREISAAEVADPGGSEDEESAFAEIVEYIRVAVLLVREDLRGPGGSGLVH